MSSIWGYRESNSVPIDEKPYNLGRYIVFPYNSNKIYFSVRAKKNVNLEDGKLVELKHNIRDSTKNEFIDPRGIRLTKDVELLPNPGKQLGVMELNSPIGIDFGLTFLPPPWTLLFSARPVHQHENRSIITFFNQATQVATNLTMKLAPEGFKYLLPGNEAVVHNMNTTNLNHIAIEYTENNLSVWLNGIQKQMHSGALGELKIIVIGVKELGIVSLYNRSLNKQEIVQHFIDNHVQNFTNDEVLI